VHHRYLCGYYENCVSVSLARSQSLKQRPIAEHEQLRGANQVALGPFRHKRELSMSLAELWNVLLVPLVCLKLAHVPCRQAHSHLQSAGPAAQIATGAWPGPAHLASLACNHV
jgi:hypothetical protein